MAIFTATGPGPVRGTALDDTINSTATGGSNSNGLGEVHIYAYNGNDQINLLFAPSSNITSGYLSGHHVRGDSSNSTALLFGNDVFNFKGIGTLTKTVVGRIEDFDPSRDKIQIDGVTLNFNNLPSNVRIVEYNGAHNDAGADPQQWLLITTAAGGKIFYALDGARVDMDGNGGANTGAQESHFVYAQMQNINFSTLKNVPFVDQKNYIPAGFLAEVGGLTLNDTDENATDVTTVISGSIKGDLIAAGLNDDIVNAGDGNDRVWGGSGHDKIYSEAGNDAVEGGYGNDKLYGGVGDDKLYGGAGRDTLDGSVGNDKLYGNTENDIVYGGDGNDHIEGNKNNDILYGGAGSDEFRFNNQDAKDIIKDFQNDIDTIQLGSFNYISVSDALSHATQVGNNVVFNFSSTDVLTIENASISQLSNDLLLV